jgi:hypothetical protein
VKRLESSVYPSFVAVHPFAIVPFVTDDKVLDPTPDKQYPRVPRRRVPAEVDRFPPVWTRRKYRSLATGVEMVVSTRSIKATTTRDQRSVPYRPEPQAYSRVRKKPGKAMPANILKKLVGEW